MMSALSGAKFDLALVNGGKKVIEAQRRFQTSREAMENEEHCGIREAIYMRKEKNIAECCRTCRKLTEYCRN